MQNIEQVMSRFQKEGETLVSLVVRKKGVIRAGMTFDNDLVHVVMWSGFPYADAKALSLKALQTALNKGGLITSIAKKGWAHEATTTLQDACTAVSEVKHWLADGHVPVSLSFGMDDAINFRALHVGGRKVIGARVHTKTGEVYLSGLKLGERILEPAPHWDPSSSAKTVMKEAVKSLLPIGLFAQYALSKTEDLKVGKAAAEAASESGIMIDPAHLLKLINLKS